MKAYSLLFCLALLSLSSCLEITEQLHLNNNKSGQYTFTVDMHEAQPLLDFMESFSSEAEPRHDIEAGMDEAYERLQQISGISQVTQISSNDGLLTGITFSFKDMKALNLAINSLQKNDEPEAYFSLSNNELHRLNTLDKKIKNEVEDSDFDFDLDISIKGKSVKTMMKNMVFRTEYTFDEAVSSVSNPAAQLSADRRKVTVNYYLLDEYREANTLENVIQF